MKHALAAAVSFAVLALPATAQAADPPAAPAADTASWGTDSPLDEASWGTLIPLDLASWGT